MSTIKNVIAALGYANSNTLYYPHSNGVEDNRYMQKLFAEIAPAALYFVGNKPFIIFLDSTDNNISRDLIIKVWNAQIPLVIINFENRINIYNGCSIDKNIDLLLLDKIDNKLINEHSSFSFWNITDPTFWHGYEQKLSAPKLDTIMLDNIRDATQQLKETKCAPFAVKIILRLIFIRYLIDRGVDLAYHGLCSDVIDSQTNLLRIMQDKAELYSLFSYLKDRFNGNLFELYEKDNFSEIDLLDNTSLKTLHDLMAGDLVLSSGQKSLFPMYDFNIIPIELISSIYERFLGDEKKQKDKAFYTPPYLVNYILEKTISPFIENNTSCKILDPACGSGIFLVESARKLIEKNISQDLDDFDDRKLVSIVTDNLWGVDKNSEAIDVAIFSLYITILDYKDPKTLKNFKLPLLKDINFFVSDFFSKEVEKHLSGICFDFIIGNTPWGRVEGLHEKYCEERNLPIQGKEISRSYVLRTKDFSTSNTCCCLIVTSKLLYNTKSSSVEFRKWLLEKAKIEKYTELAAIRELLFTTARGPAGILVYQYKDNIESNKRNEIFHLTLKPNIFFKLFNIIVTEKNDYKYVKQNLLLENDWAWKVLVFGYTQDFITIKHLLENYPSVMHIINKFKLKHGTGIRVADGEMQDASHLKGRWLIDAKNGIKPFEVIKENGTTFTKHKIHRAKKDKQYLFQPPYTLIKKGFDTKNYKFRAAYSEENFIYTDAVTGICGDERNKEVLLSLTGLFNSSFYSYLNLMLGSSSGIEREQGFPTEIFKYPAIVDSQIAAMVKKIENKLKNEGESLGYFTESDTLIQELDRLVLNKFALSDDVFVDYALNVQIPLVANNQVLWEQVTTEQLRNYAKTFTDYFSMILTQSKKYISANLYKNINGHYCAVEIVFQENETDSFITEYDGSQNDQISFTSRLMLNKINNLFYGLQDVINFSENSFYILKTNEYKNWHLAMAKLDLADVLDSIIRGNEVYK